MNGDFYSRNIPPQSSGVSNIESIKNVLLKRYNAYMASAKLMRKSLFASGEVYFPEGYRYEDMGFSILSFANAQSIAYVDKEKFTTYNFQLAIVGDFEQGSSDSLKDFIYETNKGRHILFVKTEQEAIDTLGK